MEKVRIGVIGIGIWAAPMRSVYIMGRWIILN